MSDRERAEREASPRGDPRQPVGEETAYQKAGFKGYSAGNKIKGRKRHILTDTDGRLLSVRIHSADIQDHDGGKTVLKA